MLKTVLPAPALRIVSSATRPRGQVCEACGKHVDTEPENLSVQGIKCLQVEQIKSHLSVNSVNACYQSLWGLIMWQTNCNSHQLD